jgi:hypothetical protein
MWLGLGGKSGKGGTRKRKSARYGTDMLKCPFGALVDLSGTGLRLRCEGKPVFRQGQVVPLSLESPQSRMTIRSRVVWIKKKGFRSKVYEVGFEFVDLDSRLSVALQNLAQFGFIPRTEGIPSTPPPPPKIKSKEALPDYYAALGLAVGATTAQIHEAYRTLARQYHPDANKSPDAAVIFDAISKAYRVLRDEELREGYDLQRSSAA